MDKKLQPQHFIECPHCHAQYDPSEILWPDNVLGQAKNIIKDPLGKIIFVDYREDQEPLAEEEFICDYCGKPFVVSVETKYRARPQDEALDFSTDKTSLL